MKILDRQLMEQATGYVENGVLKKWRYSSPFTHDIDRVLSDKQYSGEELIEDEIDYIKIHKNVIIIDGQIVKLYNFTAQLLNI